MTVQYFLPDHVAMDFFASDEPVTVLFRPIPLVRLSNSLDSTSG